MLLKNSDFLMFRLYMHVSILLNTGLSCKVSHMCKRSGIAPVLDHLADFNCDYAKTSSFIQ